MASEPVKEAEVLAKQELPGGLEPAPEFIPIGDTRGIDSITQEDVQMPRVGLAQQMSPELSEVDAKHIPGLKLGDMFNNLTKAIYGKGPLEFIPVRADPPRYVEFNPLDQGGGIRDFDVPADDPRTQFGLNGEKPVATKFYDYVIMLLPTREFIVLSCKSSNLKIARQFNSLITMRVGKPLFAGRYKIQSKMTQNAKGKFAIFDIQNAGWAPDMETFKFAEGAFEGLKRIRVINVAREPGSDDDDAATSFPTVESQGPATTGSM